MTTLFTSENLIVRSVAGKNNAFWIVTFDNYGHDRSLDRMGFAESYLRHSGICAIHVIGKGNHWYQYAEMGAAMAAIRAKTGGAHRVMTYGSSMGGYAAIRFADAVGANAILALSPQYSIDPTKMPGEKRWLQESTTIAWRAEIEGPIRCEAVPVIVFDPRGMDGEHAARIAAETPISPIVIPYGGHPIGTYFADIGLLRRIVPQVLRDTVDIAAFQRNALKRRKTSAVYLNELARCQPLVRPRTAITLARRALKIDPGSALLLHTLARRLTLAGEHAEALRYHVQAVDLSNRYLGYLFPYSEALLAAGDPARALKIAREMVAISPDNARFRAWLAHVLFAMNELKPAIEQLARAVDLDPGNDFHRKKLTLFKAYANVPSPVKPMARSFFEMLRKRLG